MSPNEASTQSTGGKTRSAEPSSVDTVAPKDPQESRTGGGPTSSGPASSHGIESSGANATAPEHRMRSGHRSGISSPASVDQLEDELAQAFGKGPAHAWEASKRVLTLAREATIEAGHARFAANFGSPVCGTCDGLKAGPGVVATCFQRKQCYFTNFKEGSTSDRQQRVIEALVSDDRKKTPM